MSKCKCGIAISVLGDCCRYCQPQEYINQLNLAYDGMEEENDELLEKTENLQRQLEESKDMVQVMPLGDGNVSIGTGELGGEKAISFRAIEVQLEIGSEYSGSKEDIPEFFITFKTTKSIDVLITQLNKLKEKVK